MISMGEFHGTIYPGHWEFPFFRPFCPGTDPSHRCTFWLGERCREHSGRPDKTLKSRSGHDPMFGKRTKNPKNYHKNLKMELEHGRLEKEKQTSTKHQFFEVVCFPGITLCTTPFLSYYASCWLVSQTLGLFTLKLGKFSLRIEKRTFRKFRETPATTMNISTTTPK